MSDPAIFERSKFMIERKVSGAKLVGSLIGDLAGLDLGAMSNIYRIMDEAGEEELAIAKLSTFPGPRIAVDDLQKNRLMTIKGNTLKTEFTLLDQNGDRLATMKKPMIVGPFSKPMFEIKGPTGELLLRGKGDWTEHDFELEDGSGKLVAKVKAHTIGSHKYKVEIPGKIDPRLALSFALTVDAVFHEK